MSDNLSSLVLTAGAQQLPVSWYFDETIFELERKLIFEASAGYVGHGLMIPGINDYRSQEWHDHARLLMRQPDGCHEISNVCRHRQAIMLEGSGKAKNIICPIHHWTYDCGGQLVAAPYFPDNPLLSLEKSKLDEWHGLLFRGPRSVHTDLANMGFAEEFDFSGYKLDRVVLHECNYNWKTFIEVYLEDYHVASFHPGLGGFVTCEDLSWQFGEWHSVQRVGIRSLQRPGSAVYQRWHEAVLDYHHGQLPKHGAIWLTYYPNVMVEWYPQVLVVSSVIPRAVNKTLNVIEFYYPERIATSMPEFIRAEQDAYMETALEDDDIAERMDRGRYALLKQGRNEVGPYQLPMEDGLQHFHAFYRKLMEPHIG
jgi:phenylpropionate dioxygenase-like ring-hydroxylating dioxygenase large terminal subunit